MDNFDSFLEKTKVEGELDIVNGSFDCQRCGKSVSSAKLDSKGNLTWTCECKYVSEIKDFWG